MPSYPACVLNLAESTNVANLPDALSGNYEVLRSPSLSLESKKWLEAQILAEPALSAGGQFSRASPECSQ